MKTIIYTLPIALLVSYSQLILKWRTTLLSMTPSDHVSAIQKGLALILDPYIVSGYLAALIGSFLWLFVIAKIPLSTGFPIYIGLTFLLVISGSSAFLNEPINPNHLIAAVLILSGIYIGSRT